MGEDLGLLRDRVEPFGLAFGDTHIPEEQGYLVVEMVNEHEIMLGLQFSHQLRTVVDAYPATLHFRSRHDHLAIERTFAQGLVELCLRQQRLHRQIGNDERHLFADRCTTLEVSVAERQHLIIEIACLELNTVRHTRIGVMHVIGLQLADTCVAFAQVEGEDHQLDQYRQEEEGDRPTERVAFHITQIDEHRRYEREDRQDSHHTHQSQQEETAHRRQRRLLTGHDLDQTIHGFLLQRFLLRAAVAGCDIGTVGLVVVLKIIQLVLRNDSVFRIQQCIPVIML